MAGYDIWSGEIRLWWSSPKRERPVNGRCRMHGGLSTGPKTPEGRQRIAESNRSRGARSKEKRGIGEEVTQRGMSG
jgi:hypothetical protein